jgi:hypothetical protein
MKFKLIGELPEGDWQFSLIRVRGEADVLVVVDLLGRHAPRMVIDGKFVVIH